jgi:hypothetical protein
MCRQGPPWRQEAFVVQEVSTAASLVGSRLATSDSSNSQIVACGSVSRSTMTNGRVARRITTVCHSTTNGTPPTGVPQLTGYLTRDFFKGK